jgi:cobalamin biosynthesis protein CobT
VHERLRFLLDENLSPVVGELINGAGHEAAQRRIWDDASSEGGRMPKMVITHSVVDVDNWLQFKAERSDAVGAMGVTNVVDLVAQDGSNNIAVTGDAQDPAAVLAAISSPPADLMATMEKHGVIPPLTVYIEK